MLGLQLETSEDTIVITMTSHEQQQLAGDLAAYLARFMKKAIVPWLRGQQVKLPIRVRRRRRTGEEEILFLESNKLAHIPHITPIKVDMLRPRCTLKN